MLFLCFKLVPSPPRAGTNGTFSANRTLLNLNTSAVVMENGFKPEALILVRFPEGEEVAKLPPLLPPRLSCPTRPTPTLNVCRCHRRSCRCQFSGGAIQRLVGVRSLPKRPFLPIQELPKATGHHQGPVGDHPGALEAQRRGDDIQTASKKNESNVVSLSSRMARDFPLVHVHQS